VRERVLQFTRLEEDVEREVDACAVSVGDEAGLFELVERELRALIAGVELLDTEVNGVGSVRDGGADGVEGAGWGEELGTGHLWKIRGRDEALRKTREALFGRLEAAFCAVQALSR
jgi:hypothetical protein